MSNISQIVISSEHRLLSWWLIIIVFYFEINFSRLERNFSKSLISIDVTNRKSSKNHYGFKSKIYNMSIPENSPGKTYAFPAPFEDKVGISIEKKFDVKYKIISGDRDKLFKADERIIGNFAFLTIRTRTSNIILNREKNDEYHLKIKATVTTQNLNNYTSESDCIVHVSVLDRNDLNPLFYPMEYKIIVPEDMAIHEKIIAVRAEDADLGINGEIYYSFLNDYNDFFAIHPTSGAISLIRQLRYSEQSRFELLAFASDRAASISHSGSQGSKAKVVIEVKQVNYYAPEIQVKLIYGTDEKSLYGIVKVTDKDKGRNGEIKKLEIIAGDPDGHFNIKKSGFKGEYFIEIHRLALDGIHKNEYNLTFRAEDKGIPALSGYKIVPVRAFRKNDSSPIFTKQLYEVSIPETSPVNTPVIRLKVTDPDIKKHSLVYLEIVGGNEGEEFRINPDSGMLYTNKNLDYESKSFYTLTVSAVDRAHVETRKQSSAKVKINIDDVNDNNPIFDDISKTHMIDENSFAGTVILKVSAKDKDVGENSYISYSIANLNEVPFEIDHFTGILRTTTVIDYETMRREYLLSIRASDWGLPYRRQAEMDLVIKILNVNDNRPQFERINCIGKIFRNIPVGTDVFTLSSIDLDNGDFITYRLMSGNEDGCFSLDSTSGVLSVSCNLTDTAIVNRALNFSSTDGMHFSDEMSIYIEFLSPEENKTNGLNHFYFGSGFGSFECQETGAARQLSEILTLAQRNNMYGSNVLKSSNIAPIPSRYGENIHAPEFIEFPRELIVSENMQLGETVVWIKGKDRDLGYNGKLIFVISDGDTGSVFRIDMDTGELQIIGYLDRERQDEYLLNITIYDLGQPQRFKSSLLPVRVLDVNDNHPIFQKSMASIHLMESTLNGSIVFRLEATDSDLEENAQITYIMITKTSDFFIDPFSGVLYVITCLDREVISKYELHVIAKDNGNPSLSSEAVIRIFVEDVNDNAPMFTINDEFIFKVREDIPQGTIISSIQATDIDLGVNAEINYYLKEEILGDVLFKIDKYTGIIRTHGYLDYETRQVHSLIVSAVDHGSPPLTSDMSVIIEVLDVNENRFAPEFADFVFVGYVMENKPKGTFVMNVSAVDADSGMNSQITYSIREGDGMGLFAVNDRGAIRTLMELDAETKEQYWITLCAQDHAVVSLCSCVQICISVLNVNDNVPLTDKPVYYPSILEGSPPGVFIFQLKAQDIDRDPLNQITYTIISGNPEGFFHMDSLRGILTTTARKLDRENQSEHTLEVSIMDNGYPVLSSTTRIVVTVNDINDHSPEFDQRFYKIQVPSTLTTNSTIFQVLAVDNDIGENGRINYFIKSGKGKSRFRIDKKTGVIYATKEFESDTEFDLTVRAEDEGNPKRSHVARLNIAIIPITKKSLYPPVIKTLNTNADVTESDRPGFLVTIIQASDVDDFYLWYNIDDGDTRNEFYIVRDNGNVLISKLLDRETQKTYNLTISVTDGTHVVKTQLYVNVIDVNDNKPHFTHEVYEVEVSENIEEESVIMQLHATDFDEDKKIFYTLHAAQDLNSLSLFRIDSLSGKVLTVHRLDREKNREHILIAIAKDQGTPANRDYAKLIIKINDHNDHYPEFSSKIIESKVLESSGIGSKVAQMFALDRDFGKNAEITYSIISGNIGNAFEIDSKMGLVTVAKTLNMSEIHEYLLQIGASDLGTPSLSSQIPLHITITFAENDPPKFALQNSLVEIFENISIGAFVAKIEAVSSSSIFYEILDDVDGVFQINPSAGVIITKDIIDYETIRSYNLSIRASNMASASSIACVIVHVLDVNDNAPFFAQNKYFGEVSEAAEIGSFVTKLAGRKSPLLLTASDSDIGVNGMIVFDIMDDVAKQYFTIESSTGAVKVISYLDYEKRHTFKFDVIISDLGSPKLFGKDPAEVTIEVKNINDCPPIFKDNMQNITLYLPTYDNVFLTQVNANDPDNEESPSIRYDIIEGNTANVFKIDLKSGVISTRNVENLQRQYILHVRASDGLYSSVTQIYISVETTENSDLVFQKFMYDFTVVENSTKIFTIGLVNVLGADLNEEIEYHILNPTNMFKIGVTSGVIETTGQIFDRELQSDYKLILEAKSLILYDKIKVVRRALTIANIEITDVNDNCPIFVNLPYYAVVSVDDLKGYIITKVQAVDLDSFENGEVRYEMKKGNGELFKVDRKTGQLTLRQTLGGNNRDYELVIAAYDRAMSPCSTETKVHINVVDKSMPVFTKQFYFGVVNENTQLYSTLSIPIKAESPHRRKLIYTIINGNDDEVFEIDFITGLIYVANKLDYERKNGYELLVRATDSIFGIFAEVPVSIKVEDYNDCYPHIEKDVYNISIIENTQVGTEVLKISAVDNDTLANSVLSFFIEKQTGNNDSAFFDIDMVEGIIYLKQNLDFEKVQQHHLVVVVSDHGTPPLSSKTNIWITVLDYNDNPPRFIDPSFTIMLSEQAVRGQFVLITKAYDLDKSDSFNLLYKIIDGNEMQTYAIDGNSGLITVRNIQNLHERKKSLLNVSVTDGVFTTFARVKIVLLPENKNCPKFSQLFYEVAIKENSVPGIHLINVTATDADFGDFSKLTYDICSADLTEYFAIGKYDGAVRTKESFDREQRSEYEILIKATDSGGKWAFATIKVKILDLNDNSPKFLVKEYKTTVKVDAELNSVILKVRAVDVDENQNIKYYIHNETLDPSLKNSIKVNEFNGEIFVTKALVEFANKILQFFVRAFDDGTPQLHADVPISVAVVRPNIEIPVLENKNLNLYVSESLSPGTILTKLRYNGNFSLKFTIPMESFYFAITDNAELLLMQTLDREQSDLHVIFVLTEMIANSNSYLTTEINIHVQDENDNIPKFKSQSYSLTVAENIDKMASILKISAEDSDCGSNGNIRYYFADDEHNISNTFDIDIYSGWITTLTTLDREIQPEYNFNILAVDNDPLKHTAVVPVKIKLRDYNDNPLYFKEQLYETSIEENALPGTVLLHLSLFDLDEKESPADFFIIEGDIFSKFQIGKTGELFISQNLDREEKSFYNLSIVATDGKFMAKTLVHVLVRDVNDNIPYCLIPRYKVFINESLPIGTSVVKIDATDSDENGAKILRYYLTGTGSDDFAVEKETGMLTVAKMIDRESQAEYIIFVHVQDGLHLQWECMSEIVIILNDLNDNKPEFSMSPYIVSISEDAQVGTLVTKIHASDKDIGLNRKVLYSFTEEQDYFGIYKENGLVTLIKALDRENISVFNISIRSEDCGTPKFVTTSSLIIYVLDINDNPPEFMLKNYEASIEEESKLQTEIITVSASSRDTGVNAEILYFINGGNEQNKFIIDSNSGSILVNGNIDYEKTKGYLLTIQAVDGGTPPLSNEVSLNISVIDINDNQPKFLQNLYRVKVKEDISLNEKILQVIAVDDDSGENSAITYNIESGNRLDQFSIDEYNGYIWISSLLDRESNAYYLLEVKACDGGKPKLCSHVHVHVDILDANDSPPVFVNNNFSIILQENRELGYALVKFEISDEDEYPNSSPYTFDFRSGNERDCFRLEQDGTLRTAAKFNHKVRDGYLLQIRVFDNGTPPLFSDAWVDIKVVEESQYPPIITPLEITVNSFEDAYEGGFLGRLFASDQDKYDTLYYNLSSVSGEKYALDTLFNITHVNGNMYAKSNIDVGIYKVNTTVSDGKFVTSGIVKVNVELIDSIMLQHAVILQFSNVTIEKFILSHRKGLIRSIRKAMPCRQMDVIIISIQASIDDNELDYLRNSPSLTKSLSQTPGINKNLDILFTVRKQQVNPISVGYFTPDEIRTTILNILEEIEEATNLVVHRVLQKIICLRDDCVNGNCKDKIILNGSFTTVYTDVISFVFPKFTRARQCECKQGFSGKACDEIVNVCSSNPCRQSELCLPSKSGFQCLCAPHNNELNSSCNKSYLSVSYRGQSYTHYKIDKSASKDFLENKLNMFLRVRTLQQTATLMYALGKIDYNILEIVDGAVQYKFELGSGEGVVSVTTVYVSDGKWHTVNLERVFNKAKLVVDNKHVSQGIAPGINEVLNIQSSDIFIGAEVRPHPSVQGLEVIQRGFVGCLDNVRIFPEILPLHVSDKNDLVKLTRFQNVEFTCNPSLAVMPLGVCGSQPCMNGGLCIDSGNDDFKCHCHARYSGDVCQFDLNPCASSPCLFGGQCHSENFGNYSCICPLHLSGKQCEFGKFCVPNPCKNGGVCEEGDGIPICMCRGYTGTTCEIDVNECDNQPCGDGATCINEAGSFRCICPSYLTGASCGDPLYSNSIAIRIKNLSLELIIGMLLGGIFVSSFIVGLCLIFCKKKKSRTKKRPYKEENLNSLLSKNDYKCKSKLSNLGVNQHSKCCMVPTNDSFTVNAKFVNNLEVLRNYGSAGDELDNIPFEYQKINRTNQEVNINNKQFEHHPKQSWSDHRHLRTFSENKLNNGQFNEFEYYTNRPACLEANESTSGKFVHITMHNGSNIQYPMEISNNGHEQYHWDCSDWVRNSQNPLPDITEVPSAEIADSSSIRSNDSNYSQFRIRNLVRSADPFDRLRDITILNEDIMQNCNESAKKSFSKPYISLSLERKLSTKRLKTPNDIKSEDYKSNAGAVYLRHSNSYLPSFNIPCESNKNSKINAGSENESNTEENKTKKNGSSENMFLLHSGNYEYNGASNSDVSVKLCEIEDSEFDEFLPTTNNILHLTEFNN